MMSKGVKDKAKLRIVENEQAKRFGKWLSLYGNSKPTEADLFELIRDTINGESTVLEPFPVCYYVVKEEGGTKNILRQVKGSEVRYAHKQELVDDLTTYTCNSLKHGTNAMFRWNVSKCEKAVDFWLATTPKIDMPKLVTFKGDDSLTFSHLPFDIDYKGDTPLIDEIMSRCSDARALKLFVGSLFFEDSYRQQYIWIWGEGGQGKGTICSILQSVLKNACYFKTVPKTASEYRFMYDGIAGKRLVIFDDCDPDKFLSSGNFKAVTGADTVEVDVKGKPAYNHRINAKFMFTSNDMPEISGEHHDLRRLIVCHVKTRENSNFLSDAYKDKIMATEAAYFIAECIRLFRDTQALKEPILASAVSQASVNDIVSNSEAWALDIFEESCNLLEGGEVTAAAFLFVMRHRLNIKDPREKKIKDLKKIWSRVYKIQWNQKDNTGNRRVHKGFTLKHGF